MQTSNVTGSQSAALSLPGNPKRECLQGQVVGRRRSRSPSLAPKLRVAPTARLRPASRDVTPLQSEVWPHAPLCAATGSSAAMEGRSTLCKVLQGLGFRCPALDL